MFVDRCSQKYSKNNKNFSLFTGYQNIIHHYISMHKHLCIYKAYYEWRWYARMRTDIC